MRQNGKIRGPFPNQLISRYLILGRIDLDTPVSQDQEHWTPVREFNALVPDLVLNAHTPEGHKALMLARIREDERSARAVETELPDNADRRIDEDQIIKLHRQLRDDVLSRYRSQPELARRNIGLVILAAAILFVALLVYRPANQVVDVDCSTPAGPGVDWSACNKQGLNLVGRDLSGGVFKATQLNAADLTRSRLEQADLSYANLSRADMQQASLHNASMIGTNLRMANLQGAVLSGANLAFAELEGARLEGAVLDGARFDNAIWINGEQCLPGSLGVCLLPK